MKWIRKKVLDGDIMAGIFLALGSGCITELAGRAGLDWVLIDTEHGLGDYKDLVSQIQAAKITAAAPVVRVVANEPAHFKRALDLGAAGIMVPQVNNADEARNAVKAMRYPPEGIRGLTRTSWAGGFGYEAEEYLLKANDNLLTVIQIETKAAVENVDQIAAVDGVDVLFVGPSDLSCNLGIPCDLDHPEFKQCVLQVKNAAEKYGKRTGILIKNPDQLERVIADGFSMIALNTDLTILKAGMKMIADSFKTYK